MGKKYLDTKENSIESAVMQVWQEAAKLNEYQKVNGEFKKVDGGDGRKEKKMKTETNKNDKSDDGEGLDAVQPKAVKKKFDARKDKDIDNDGDVDSSDKFLHKRRKAVSKAMKEAKQKPYVSSDRGEFHVMNGSGKIAKSFTDKRLAQAYWKKNYDDLMKESPEQMDEIVGAIGKAAGKVVGGAAKLAGKAAGSVAKGVGSAVGGTVKGAAKGVGSAVGGTVKGTKKVVGGAVKGTASATKKVVGSITSQYEGLEDSPNAANSQHLCAKNVVHEEWGEGQPVHGMHAIPNSDGDIAWYDVMFEHGIEKGVSINELKVRAAESHHDHGGKKSKKEGAMKRGKDLDTFKPKSESFEQHQEFKVQSMKEAMQKVWEVAEQDRLFETYADMSDEAFDALLEEADKAQLEGIVGALGRGIKKVATMGTASNRADRAEKKLGKAQVKVDNKARVATAKAKTAQLKKDNPSMVKRAAGAVGSAMMGKKKEI